MPPLPRRTPLSLVTEPSATEQPPRASMQRAVSRAARGATGPFARAKSDGALCIVSKTAQARRGPRTCRRALSPLIRAAGHGLAKSALIKLAPTRVPDRTVADITPVPNPAAPSAQEPLRT